jgi:menaquinone-dependent protoporphyrinogen IX oxidase
MIFYATVEGHTQRIAADLARYEGVIVGASALSSG